MSEIDLYKKAEMEKKDKMERELKELFAQLEYRQLNYGICDAKLDKIPAQQEVLQTLMDRLKIPEKERVQYMLYF